MWGKKANATRWGGYTLVVVAVVSVGVALFLSLRPTDLLKYQDEWVKALLHSGLIAVLGVVTTGVLEVFKEGLQRRRDQSKIRFDVLADVGRIYMDVKLIRRKAQKTESIEENDFQELNERQVQLELHKHNSGNLFNNRKGFEESIEKMEKYLNRVANKPRSDEHQRFTEREGFKEFSNAFHEANSIMQHDIVSH